MVFTLYLIVHGVAVYLELNGLHLIVTLLTLCFYYFSVLCGLGVSACTTFRWVT